MLKEGEAVPSKTPDTERWTGTFFTFLATFFFATSHVAVRYLTELEIDVDWILFYKEIIGFSIIIPWLLLRWCQGRYRFTSRRLIIYLLLAAILCQLVGSRLQVFGFAIIGLIIVTPLLQSSMLLGIALLGRFFAGARLSRRRKIAIAILIVAVVIVSIGKEMTASGQSHGTEPVSAGLFLLAALGTITAGIAFAAYVIVLRYVVRQQWADDNSARLSFKFRHWIGHDRHDEKQPDKQPGERYYSPFPVTLVIGLVLAVGIVIFGILLYSKHGVEGFYNVPNVAWYAILVSGVANVAGFFFQIQGLRMTSAVQAAIIAVSQILVLTLIGYLYFHEAINILVIIGLVLTVYGVLTSAKPEK